MKENKRIKLGQVHINSLGIPDKNVKNFISGEVNSDNNAESTVLLYDRTNGELISSCMTDMVSGQFEVFSPPQEDEKLTIVCRDEGGDFNSDIFDRVSLCYQVYQADDSHNNIVSYNYLWSEYYSLSRIYDALSSTPCKITKVDSGGDIEILDWTESYLGFYFPKLSLHLDFSEGTIKNNCFNYSDVEIVTSNNLGFGYNYISFKDDFMHKAPSKDSQESGYSLGGEDTIKSIKCVFSVNDGFLISTDQIIWKSGDSVNGICIAIKNSKLGVYAAKNSILTKVQLTYTDFVKYKKYTLIYSNSELELQLLDSVLEKVSGTVESGPASVQETIGGANESPIGIASVFQGRLYDLQVGNEDSNFIYDNIAVELGDTGQQCDIIFSKYNKDRNIAWVKIPTLSATSENKIKVYAHRNKRNLDYAKVGQEPLHSNSEALAYQQKSLEDKTQKYFYKEVIEDDSVLKFTIPANTYKPESRALKSKYLSPMPVHSYQMDVIEEGKIIDMINTSDLVLPSDALMSENGGFFDTGCLSGNNAVIPCDIEWSSICFFVKGSGSFGKLGLTNIVSENTILGAACDLSDYVFVCLSRIGSEIKIYADCGLIGNYSSSDNLNGLNIHSCFVDCFQIYENAIDLDKIKELHSSFINPLVLENFPVRINLSKNSGVNNFDVLSFTGANITGACTNKFTFSDVSNNVTVDEMGGVKGTLTHISSFPDVKNFPKGIFSNNCSIDKSGVQLDSKISFISFSIWIRHTGSFGNDVCFFLSNGNGYANGSSTHKNFLLLNRDSGNNLLYCMGYPRDLEGNQFTIRDTEWHHVYFSHLGENKGILYLDGKQSAVYDLSFPQFSVVHLGLWNTPSTAYYLGGIANVQFYKTRGTPEQISFLYAQETTASISGGSVHDVYNFNRKTLRSTICADINIPYYDYSKDYSFFTCSKELSNIPSFDTYFNNVNNISSSFSSKDYITKKEVPHYDIKNLSFYFPNSHIELDKKDYSSLATGYSFESVIEIADLAEVDTSNLDITMLFEVDPEKMTMNSNNVTNWNSSFGNFSAVVDGGVTYNSGDDFVYVENGRVKISTDVSMNFGNNAVVFFVLDQSTAVDNQNMLLSNTKDFIVCSQPGNTSYKPNFINNINTDFNGSIDGELVSYANRDPLATRINDKNHFTLLCAHPINFDLWIDDFLSFFTYHDSVPNSWNFNGKIKAFGILKDGSKVQLLESILSKKYGIYLHYSHPYSETPPDDNATIFQIGDSGIVPTIKARNGTIGYGNEDYPNSKDSSIVYKKGGTRTISGIMWENGLIELFENGKYDKNRGIKIDPSLIPDLSDSSLKIFGIDDDNTVNGKLKELRVHNVTRSPEWINLTHLSWNDELFTITESIKTEVPTLIDWKDSSNIIEVELEKPANDLNDIYIPIIFQKKSGVNEYYGMHSQLLNFSYLASSNLGNYTFPSSDFKNEVLEFNENGVVFNGEDERILTIKNFNFSTFLENYSFACDFKAASTEEMGVLGKSYSQIGIACGKSQVHIRIGNSSYCYDTVVNDIDLTKNSYVVGSWVNDRYRRAFALTEQSIKETSTKSTAYTPNSTPFDFKIGECTGGYGKFKGSIKTFSIFPDPEKKVFPLLKEIRNRQKIISKDNLIIIDYFDNKYPIWKGTEISSIVIAENKKSTLENFDFFSNVLFSVDNEYYQFYTDTHTFKKVISSKKEVTGYDGFCYRTRIWNESESLEDACTKYIQHIVDSRSEFCSPTDFAAITRDQFNTVYDKGTGEFKIALLIHPDDFYYVSNITINNKDIQVSNEFDLDYYLENNSIQESCMIWSEFMTPEKDSTGYAKFYVMIGENTEWKECENGKFVPGLFTGFESDDTKMVFKVELDREKENRNLWAKAGASFEIFVK